MLERRGATVQHAPALRIVPLADDTQLLAATRELIERPPDITVATTGIGFRGWVDAADGWGFGEELLRALGAGELIARGPKARGAIRATGLVDAWSPPSESSAEVLEHLLARGVEGCASRCSCTASRCRTSSRRWTWRGPRSSRCRCTGGCRPSTSRPSTGCSTPSSPAASTSWPSPARPRRRACWPGRASGRCSTTCCGRCAGRCWRSASGRSRRRRWRPWTCRPCSPSAPASAPWCGGWRPRCPPAPGGCRWPGTGWSCAGTPCSSTVSCARWRRAGMALLRALARRPGRVVARAELLRALPGTGAMRPPARGAGGAEAGADRRQAGVPARARPGGRVRPLPRRGRPVSELVSELSAQRPAGASTERSGASAQRLREDVDRAQRGRAVNAQLLLVAHGTRDPAGAAVTEAVAEQVRGLLGVRVAVCYADVRHPTPAEALAELPGAGGGGADVPRGGLPRAGRRARAARRHRPRRRAARRDVRPRPRARRRRGVPAARGGPARRGRGRAGRHRLQRPATRRPTGPRRRVGWRGSCARRSRWPRSRWAGRGCPTRWPGCAPTGRERVAVASWLLAPGLFQRALVASGADVVAEPLATHEAVARLVVARYTAALANRTSVA